MHSRYRWLPFMVAVGLITCFTHATADDRAPLHEGEQTRVLIDGTSALGWNAVEGTLTPTTIDGEPAMLFRIPVDWHGGEANYPVGWPRIQTNYTEEQGDWRGWDLIRLRILPRSSTGSLPFRPLGITITSQERGGWERDIPSLKYGEWQGVTFDLRDVVSPEKVRANGIFISEDKYADGTTLDFYISRLELVRYIRPTVVEFAPVASATFTDAKSLPIKIKMYGVPEGKTVPVQLALKREGKVIATSTVQVGNGETQLTLPLKKPVVPGEYSISAVVSGNARSVPIRFVTSPWQEVKP